MGMGMAGTSLGRSTPPAHPSLLLQRCFQTNGYLSDSRSCSSNYNVAALATSSLVGRWQLLSPSLGVCTAHPRHERGVRGGGTKLSCSWKACSSVDSPFSKCQAPKLGSTGSGDQGFPRPWARSSGPPAALRGWPNVSDVCLVWSPCLCAADETCPSCHAY